MAVTPKVGARFRSVVCKTEVIVLKGPGTPTDLACGGAPMVPAGSEGGAAGAVDPQYRGGTKVGKRYGDADNTLELLCSKGGEGSLSIGNTPLGEKAVKPLPASD